MQTHTTLTRFQSSESWSILSDIERSIKAKIEAIGIPLKNWDVKINYGIKTGFNDAFIIDSVKRKEILDACQSDEERNRTADIIRPILRGRDIKRYGYEWADLWLIFIPWHFPYQFDESIQGASNEAESSFKEQYPTIYSHMLQFKKPLSERNKAETGIRYEWYAMQRWGANYLDDLSKTKIAWIELSDESKFTLCDDLVPVNTVFFLTGTHLQHILGLLNSKLIHWYFTTNLGTSSGVGTNRWLKYTIEQLPLVEYSNETLSQLVASRLSPDAEIDQCERKIDTIVCEMYGLSPAEASFIIESC